MADVSLQTYHTFVELAKRTNNKELLDIAEVLDEENEIIADAIWHEANLLAGHKHTRRAYVGTSSDDAFRDINDGVSPSVMQTEQYVEPIGLMEDRSEIDEALVDLAPNPQQYRYEEDIAHIEGMAQKFAYNVFNGDSSSNTKCPDGLITRYNTLSLGNVWDCGGSGGDTTSVFLIQWGPKGVFFVYPRNSPNMGVEMNDLGKQLITTTAPARYLAYMTQFKMNFGIVIRDDNAVQRITNIEDGGAANLFDENQAIRALNHMPRKGKGAIMYVNETVLSQIEIMAKDKPNVFYTSEDAFGKPVTYFNRRIPIHLCDQIGITETAVA